MQITFLNLGHSCKPMSHNEFALTCVRLHQAPGHALCKEFGSDATLAFVEEPVERGLGDLHRRLVHAARRHPRLSCGGLAGMTPEPHGRHTCRQPNGHSFSRSFIGWPLMSLDSKVGKKRCR